MQLTKLFVPISTIIESSANPSTDVLVPEAPVIRDQLLERSKAIERVAGGVSNDIAVQMKGELQDLLKTVESLRKKYKDPFLTVGRRIDAAAATYVESVTKEVNRISRMLSDFAAEQDRIAREAQRKQEEELARLRAERKEAEFAATIALNQQEREAAQEAILKADTKAVEVFSAPVVAPIKSAAQRTTPRWDTKVNDPAALYKVFPDLVRLEPKMREINAEVKKMADAQPDMEPKLPGCVITKEFVVSAK
jgi:DNA repair exonuclease SbcCD ATPase subunit